MTAIPSDKKAELPKNDKEIKINILFMFFIFVPSKNYFKLKKVVKFTLLTKKIPIFFKIVYQFQTEKFLSYQLANH